MSWNNGYEQKNFEEEQKRLAKEYRAAGMSEEQIYQMYLYDLERHNSLRREREHTQSFPDGFPEDDPEGTSPLNRKFLSAVTTEITIIYYSDRVNPSDTGHRRMSPYILCQSDPDNISCRKEDFRMNEDRNVQTKPEVVR